MTWNYHEDSEWKEANLLKRSGGEWVPIDESEPSDPDPTDEPPTLEDGELGSNYEHLGGPPTRSGDTLTVDASGGADYTTIQAAIDAVSGDETILVEPGTYNENLVIDENRPEGFTLQGNGASREDVEVVGDGTQRVMLLGDFSISGNAESDVTSTLSRGDTFVPVASASGFEPGMDILIRDPNQEVNDGGDSVGIIEFQTIESIDTSPSGEDHLIIEHDQGIVQEYTENSVDHIAREIDWKARDIHIDNMSFDGMSDGTHESRQRYGVGLRVARDIWMTNLRFKRGAHQNASAGWCWYTRWDNCRSEDTVRSSGVDRGYGFSLDSAGGAHLLTNVEHLDSNAYCVTFAGSHSNYYGGAHNRAYKAHAVNLNNYGFDTHEGGWECYFEHCTATDCDGMGRISAPGQRYLNCTMDGHSTHGIFRVTNYSYDCTINDFEAIGPGRDNDNYMIRFEHNVDFPPHHDFECRRWSMNFDSDFTDDSDVGSVGMVTSEPLGLTGYFIAEDIAWPVSDIVDKFETEEEFCSYTGGAGCDAISDGTLDIRTTDWQPE